MLTHQEQQAVLKTVKRLVFEDRRRRRRVQSQAMCPKTAKKAEEREFSALADMLKELG